MSRAINATIIVECQFDMIHDKAWLTFASAGTARNSSLGVNESRFHTLATSGRMITEW